MTPDQVTLVRSSFAQVQPISAAAAAMFYERLFDLDPTLRGLFHIDIPAQGHKLMTMIALAVKNLDRPDVLVPAARQLGQRHATYGVQPEHYATVGAALLWTLERGLGDGWTAQVRDAWTTTYELLRSTMLSGADPISTNG